MSTKRQPAGVATGGQFAPNARDEGDVALEALAPPRPRVVAAEDVWPDELEAFYDNAANDPQVQCYIYGYSQEANASPDTRYAVAYDGTVLGAIHLEPLRSKPPLADSKLQGAASFVITVVVADHARGEGVGQRLVEATLADTESLTGGDGAGPPERIVFIAEIDDNNYDSQVLFERNGFRPRNESRGMSTFVRVLERTARTEVHEHEASATGNPDRRPVRP